jgi:penicillin-binding protein 1C
VRSDFRGRTLPWVFLPEISPALVQAVLRSEDKRFRRHTGVDAIALLSALADTLRGRARGGSTITMQLASLIEGGGRRRHAAGMVRAKFGQMRSALRLERTWTKDEILEAYLNLVTWRGELRGIAAASRGMFGKEPGGLDRAESAVLAALLRSPNAPAGQAARRASLLSSSLGWGNEAPAIEALAGERLQAPFAVRPRYALAPHAARVLAPGPGERIVSTLDASMQKFAAEALSRQLAALSAQNVRHGAVLVVENAGGEILAYVTSCGLPAEIPLVDGIPARRQAGSTLKPFLYGLAIQKRILTAASLLDDSPIDVPTERGLYVPRNYDREFRGLVSVRTSLASSLNVPAVRTLLLVGPEALAGNLASFGIALPDSGEDYGASLALGTADVTLRELVEAYRALANGGRWGPTTLRPRDKAPRLRRVMGREAAHIVSDILSDRGARGTAFGLANPLATPFWTAVKTGTSKDMRDNWCIGYSGRYTVGVWVGNFSGEPMWNVSGVSGAAPVWTEIMLRLHEGDPARPSAPPPGLTARRVSFPGGIEDDRTEWFLEGTEPAVEAVAIARGGRVRIRYPADGTIVALDPDIPGDRQLLFFEAQGTQEGHTWRLDGRPFGPAGPLVPWIPEGGSHVLSLLDAQHRVADTVAFSVRGRNRTGLSAIEIPKEAAR